MDSNLIVFVKYPDPGKVKTRIARVIGDEKAADLYSSLVYHIINKIATSDNFKISIAFTPRNKENLIKKWISKDGIDHFPQSGKTLGERISNSFDRSFSNGFQNTIVIGSDCIELDHKIIRTAFAHLDKGSDCVIGPTYDGGYYLIGLRYKNFPYIFEDIPWSSDSVFDETIKKINSLNIRCAVLKKLNDVDDVSDIDNNVMKLLEKYPLQD